MRKRLIDEEMIREALQTIQHPKLQKSLIDLSTICNISIKDEVVTLALALKNGRSPLKKVCMDEIEKAVGSMPEVSSVQVEVETLSKEDSKPLFPKAPLKSVEKVKHFLAVAGGNWW